MKSKNLSIYKHSTGFWRISLRFQRIAGAEYKLLTSVLFKTKQEAIVESVYMRTILEVYGMAKWKETRDPDTLSRSVLICTAKYQEGLQRLRASRAWEESRTGQFAEDITRHNIDSLTDLQLGNSLRLKCGWSSLHPYGKTRNTYYKSTKEAYNIVWWFEPGSNFKKRSGINAATPPPYFEGLDHLRSSIGKGEIDLDNEWYRKQCHMGCKSFRQCFPLCVIVAETIAIQQQESEVAEEAAREAEAEEIVAHTIANEEAEDTEEATEEA